jgi:hypothetical protein
MFRILLLFVPCLCSRNKTVIQSFVSRGQFGGSTEHVVLSHPEVASWTPTPDLPKSVNADVTCPLLPPRTPGRSVGWRTARRWTRQVQHVVVTATFLSLDYCRRGRALSLPGPAQEVRGRRRHQPLAVGPAQDVHQHGCQVTPLSPASALFLGCRGRAQEVCRRRPLRLSFCHRGRAQEVRWQRQHLLCLAPGPAQEVRGR